MTFAMLRTAPPAGRFLYGDIALLSEDEDENGSEGSGSDEHSSNAFHLSSSSPSAFHIKMNRKRKMCAGIGIGGVGMGGMLGRLAPPGMSPPGEIRQRTAANARERDRTNSVNTAFTALRTLIPTEPADRKLSKIETLRLASSYISHLGNVLLLGEGLHDGQPCHAPSPPFFHVNSSPNRGSDQSTQPKHICTFCLSNQRKMNKDRDRKTAIRS
ncbi:basic helix-loop-helix transcription factor scleraxis-like [Hippoglossus hippoglossus]|uniref:basic helix-loop-helix transcription factor scleraxis-like n=1 Tax=Hippoglossus hippoglossus TaxID=8267 RepID=UPI00148C5ACB|nr:basic helix-loop-helix transcription factor scleraxis-like [Hippoglossus hippoglossus]XP_035019953.1 basic helix-loop-helix transcription factor scleraxis [Hippoglossus stenolepis]